MADQKKRNVIASLSGGRNGFSPPWEIADNECADAVNVDFYGTPFARKRGGMASLVSSGATVSGTYSSLARHVPGTDPTLAEMWATDDVINVNRLAGGTVWTAPTLKDAPTGNGWDFSYASINGKLMMAYKSGQPRMHLWDGSTVRRAGIATTIAPTVGDSGSATGAAFDSSATGGTSGTSLTFSHTMSAAAGGLLIVHTVETAGTITGVTYNGVSMGAFSSQTITVGGLSSEVGWQLNAPSSGTHNVVVTASGTTAMVAQSISYIGVSGLTLAANKTAASVTQINYQVTVANTEWMVGFSAQDPATSTGDAPLPGTTIRQISNTAVAVDSNGPLSPAGLKTLSVTYPTASNVGWIAASMATLFPQPYSVVQRFYRVRWTRQSSGITLGRSEPSAIIAFTPSGASLAALITQPTPPNEGETHWELEASIDGVTFYRIATIVVGTTTYSDAAATTSYGANPLSALTGFYTLPPAGKFIAADQGRLLMFGSYTTTDKQNDVVISAVIGSSNISDEERVDTTTNYRIGLDENDSGVPTGLIGPVNNAYLAFKDRQTWLLTATGSVSQPYNSTALSKTVGAVCATAMDKGEDSTGNSCAYWMSHRGAFRWGIGGLEYIGRNMEDYILPSGNSVAQINLGATHQVAVVRYFPDKRQVWFWFATGASNDPNQLAIYDIVTSGWTRVPTQDHLANVRCAVMFSNTIGASMSRDLKPYVGISSGNLSLKKADTGTDDYGTNFQAYVITKAVEPGGQGFYGECGDSELLAKTASGVTISKTTIVDFGQQTKLSTVTLTADGAETRVTKKFQESGVDNVKFIQHQLGDGVAVSNSWSLERLITPMTQRGAVTK